MSRYVLCITVVLMLQWLLHVMRSVGIVSHRSLDVAMGGLVNVSLCIGALSFMTRCLHHLVILFGAIDYIHCVLLAQISTTTTVNTKFSTRGYLC